MTIIVSLTAEHFESLNDKNNGTQDPRMFLDLNGEDYEIVVHDSVPSDILILTKKEFLLGRFRTQPSYKIAVLLDLWHGSENQFVHLSKSIKRPNEYIVTCVVNKNDHPQIIPNDFMFNRTKAYYSQYPFSPGVVKWYSHGQPSYIAPDLPSPEHKKKIFVAPCKTYPESPRFSRTRLRDFLLQHQARGYLGNIDEDPNLFLYPHIEFPWTNDISEIESQTRPLSYNWWGYSPPHNEYYKNTFISVYSETIEYGDNIIITEKTYDPMLKGHFILPFSNHRFVEYVTNLGFKFPDFIDYSYDNIVDNEQRLQAYFDELQRLINMPLDQWRQNYSNNIKLLRHNQLMFHNRPYDRVDLVELLKLPSF